MNGGVVWEFSAAGQFTVLHAFAGFPVDGANPYAGVTLDAQGNLYGTTSYGGTVGDLGTVFKLSPGGAITLLHTFTTIPQAYPQSGLAIDSAGNLYGGLQGAVYEVSASGVYTQFALPRGRGRPGERCARAGRSGQLIRGDRRARHVSRERGCLPGEPAIRAIEQSICVPGTADARRAGTGRGLPQRQHGPRREWRRMRRETFTGVRSTSV